MRTSVFSFVFLLHLSLTLVFASEEDKVIILYTNDVHTSLDAGVSYAGVAAYKKAMETQYGADDVLLVDAGDFIQGGPVGILTQGGAVIDVLNRVGYDYVTLGNHEFDYGFPRLYELIDTLEAQVVSCNITYTKDGSVVFTPYSMEELQGLKVAFVGITTPESFTKSTPAFFQDATGAYLYSFAEGNAGQDLYATVQKTVDTARAAGAQVVIALAHLGMDDESSPWMSLELIQNTTGIDVVIDGHSHSTVPQMMVKNKAGADTLLTQTGTRLQNLGVLTLDTKTKEISTQLLNTLPEKDESTLALLDKINNELAVILEKTVANTEVTLTTSDAAGQALIRTQETNLGNLVADAYRAALGTQVAMINGGGIRSDIQPGDITYNEIISVLPFGNDGVSLSVSGQTILNALEMGARALPGPSGGFMHVSGMEYTIDSSIPSSVKTDDKGNFISVNGPYRVKNVLIDGKPLDLKTMYSVASSTYTTLNSGDGMTMFRDADLIKDKYMVDNEILIQYIAKNLGGVVGKDYANIHGQGRITVLK